MTATDESLPKVTSESSSESPVVAPSTTSEPHGTTTPQPTVTSNAPSTPPAVHTPSDTPAPPRNDGDNDRTSPTAPPVDPKVAVLLGMFPDFDVSLLQSVLQSVSGDQERAIDVLLGMSDPEYKSTARPDVTQTELDEEIARRIMMEETEQQRRAWQPNVAPTGAPYQQRSHMGGPPPQGANQQGDGIAQFQEQLGKFAETGKKTFNTLFSKVKAKIQEFDSPPGQAQPSGSSHPLPHGDSWNTPAQAQSYYDPNPPHSVEGYDVAGAEHPPRGATMRQGSPPTVPKEVSTAASAAASPPTNVAPTANVDPSKIGLLPKRPVSLGSSPQPSQSLNDDDVVEYVENPFEESNRR